MLEKVDISQSESKKIFVTSKSNEIDRAGD